MARAGVAATARSVLARRDVNPIRQVGQTEKLRPGQERIPLQRCIKWSHELLTGTKRRQEQDGKRLGPAKGSSQFGGKPLCPSQAREAPTMVGRSLATEWTRFRGHIGIRRGRKNSLYDNNLRPFRSVISLPKSVISSSQLGNVRQQTFRCSANSLLELGNERHRVLIGPSPLPAPMSTLWCA